MNFKEQYFNIWQQIWNLHKKYYNIRADDEKAWERLDQECKQLDQQYKNKSEQKFVQSLLLAANVQKQQENRKHSLDRFQKWSMKVIEESRKQKGDHGNEKKEIKEKVDLLCSGHLELGGLPNPAGQV